MNAFSRAFQITLRKRRPLAPPFHQHIARSKLLGKPWRTGDRVVVYEIVETVPEGRVLVTDETILRFE